MPEQRKTASPTERRMAAARRALAWQEGEKDGNPAWEPTYRDGSTKNECWNSHQPVPPVRTGRKEQP